MILTGPEIHKQVKAGQIMIDPFYPERLNPNSYNFQLGGQLKVYTQTLLDPAQEMEFESIQLGGEGLVLSPHRLYLGHIEEKIGSDYYVPMIKGRSSVGRLGLFINITADLVDQGAFGQWTLQMHAVQPLRIYPGMLIGQMTFWRPIGEPMLYEGKYQNAEGPGESQSWRDFQ
jgi:dCTP deaminase